MICNKRLFWYIKSCTSLCVLASWDQVLRKDAYRRLASHPSVHPSALSAVPPPPAEKARRGWRSRRRSRRARRVVVSWRAACAWPVPRRRVEHPDTRTLLRITQHPPSLRCMYCDRLTDSGAHLRLTLHADKGLGIPQRMLEPPPETPPSLPGT